MDSDPRTHGTFFQNAELLGAAWADSIVDSPVWIYNKFSGSQVEAPIDLASKVYAVQSDGLYTDPDGVKLSREEIEARAEQAEDVGIIIDAGEATADQIAGDPLSIIPLWAKVIAVIAVALVALYYGSQIYRAAAT